MTPEDLQWLKLEKDREQLDQAAHKAINQCLYLKRDSLRTAMEQARICCMLRNPVLESIQCRRYAELYAVNDIGGPSWTCPWDPVISLFLAIFGFDFSDYQDFVFPSGATIDSVQHEAHLAAVERKIRLVQQHEFDIARNIEDKDTV